MLQRGQELRSGRGTQVEIGGRDRYKFFQNYGTDRIDGGTQTLREGQRTLPLAYRPILCDMLSGQPPALANDSVKNSSPTRSGSTSPKRAKMRFISTTTVASGTYFKYNADGISRDVCCQTDYRENETQTAPYTPDYIIPEGENPELLAVIELKAGKGLPAGLAEVEMIDRIRRRRWIESQLPQGTDDTSMQKRQDILEALEKQEWAEREQHIQELQDEKLEKIEKALRLREARRQEQSCRRVELLKRQKLADVERKLSSMQERRLGTTLKLMSIHGEGDEGSGTKIVKATKKGVCIGCGRGGNSSAINYQQQAAGNSLKRDLIKAHALYGLKAKPVSTCALFEKNRCLKGKHQYDIRPTLLTFKEGIEEIERNLPESLLTVTERKFYPPEDFAIKSLSTNFLRRNARQIVDDLQYADLLIEESHKDKSQKGPSVQDLYRATPRLKRPHTPFLRLHGDDDEEVEESVLLLQRLLRGRAVQNDFYEGKERCHGLIEELQVASKAKEASKVWEKAQQKEALALQRDDVVQSIVDEAEGDIVFEILDYLFKELVRQKEMYKVNKLRDTAEAQRQQLESEEVARRAREREEAALREGQYEVIMRAVDNTVDSYVAQIFDFAVQDTAHAEAVKEQWMKRKELRRLAENQEQFSVDDRRDKNNDALLDENGNVVDVSGLRTGKSDPKSRVQAEKLVCALLDQFVVPEAIRNIKATQVRPEVIPSSERISGGKDRAKK